VTCKAVLINSRTIQAENGLLLRTPVDVDEFRVEGEEFIVRFTHDGKVREAAHRCENLATTWSIRTESGIRITLLGQDQMVLAFPHGEARLPGKCGAVAQRGDLALVTLVPDGTNMRNVYGYDLSGRQLWRIGQTDGSVRVFPYTGADFETSGAVIALNPLSFSAILDPDTGAILEIRRGAW
jgi:hypothetical protein